MFTKKIFLCSRNYKSLFYAQYNNFCPNIHNIYEYPCKKNLQRKINFIFWKLRKDHFLPSKTISALVYTPICNTPVKKKKIYFMPEKLKTFSFSPSTTLSALIYRKFYRIYQWSSNHQFCWCKASCPSRITA